MADPQVNRGDSGRIEREDSVDYSRLSKLEAQTARELWERGDDLSIRAAVFIEKLADARSESDHYSEIERLAGELEARAEEAFEASNDPHISETTTRSQLGRGRGYSESAQLLRASVRTANCKSQTANLSEDHIHMLIRLLRAQRGERWHEIADKLAASLTRGERSDTVGTDPLLDTRVLSRRRAEPRADRREKE